MTIKRFRWFVATLALTVTGAIAILLSNAAWPTQTAEAGQTQTGGWALVNLNWGQVIAVYPDSFDHHDLYAGHPVLRLVKIPNDVTVEAHNTYWDGETFIARSWGWWLPTPTLTPTPSASGTVPTPEPTATSAPAPTVAPTATGTPAPTATPSGPTLESQIGELWAAVTALQADRDAKQLVIQELRGRIDTLEAQLATATP